MTASRDPARGWTGSGRLPCMLPKCRRMGTRPRRSVRLGVRHARRNHVGWVGGSSSVDVYFPSSERRSRGRWRGEVGWPRRPLAAGWDRERRDRRHSPTRRHPAFSESFPVRVHDVVGGGDRAANFGGSGSLGYRPRPICGWEADGEAVGDGDLTQGRKDGNRRALGSGSALCRWGGGQEEEMERAEGIEPS